MPKYMLLLHDNQEAEGWKLSPDEMQKALEKYLTWRNQPFVVDGKRLDEQTGRVIRRNNGKVTVTDGPFTEGKEVMGGYFAIQAASFEDAIRLCDNHPHLDFGSIEIREMVLPPK
jgi:hypothetical protein